MRYIARISGYSYVQIKRLAASYRKNGRLKWRHTATRGFARRYTNTDCELLATDHDKFDYALFRKHAALHAALIVDTRGVYLEPAENIVKA